MGIAAARSVHERVALAVEELERVGAFERARIVVGSPTGMGFLNPVPVEAEEIMSRGDVATVVVQYGDQRSWRSRRRVPVGRDTHRALLEALAERIGGEDGPELVIYAESLGAWAGLAALGCAGDVDRLRIARGLWVGVPYDARLHRQRVAPAGAEQTDERFGCLSSVADLERLPDARRRALRFTFFTRRDDPVANFEGLRTAYARPRDGWPEGRWMPLLTAVRAVREVVRSTDFRPGRLDSEGHDYRGDLASVVRMAFGHHDVEEPDLARIQEELLERERRRAAVQEGTIAS